MQAFFACVLLRDPRQEQYFAEAVEASPLGPASISDLTYFTSAAVSAVMALALAATLSASALGRATRPLRAR
jgi:hypothetical protein